MARNRLRDLRRRVYQVLEQGPVGDRVSRWVDRLLVALIIVNLVAVALESIPSYEERYANIFAFIEFFLAGRIHDRIRLAALVARSSTVLTSICPPRARA